MRPSTVIPGEWHVRAEPQPPSQTAAHGRHSMRLQPALPEPWHLDSPRRAAPAQPGWTGSAPSPLLTHCAPTAGRDAVAKPDPSSAPRADCASSRRGLGAVTCSPHRSLGPWEPSPGLLRQLPPAWTRPPPPGFCLQGSPSPHCGHLRGLARPLWTQAAPVLWDGHGLLAGRLPRTGLPVALCPGALGLGWLSPHARSCFSACALGCVCHARLWRSQGLPLPYGSWGGAHHACPPHVSWQSVPDQPGPCAGASVWRFLESDIG